MLNSRERKTFAFVSARGGVYQEDIKNIRNQSKTWTCKRTEERQSVSEAIKPGPGASRCLVHLPLLLLRASPLPCSFCFPSYTQGHQKLLHFKLSVLTTQKQIGSSSLIPKSKMSVEGTSRSCFSSGAHLLNREWARERRNVTTRQSGCSNLDGEGGLLPRNERAALPIRLCVLSAAGTSEKPGGRATVGMVACVELRSGLKEESWSLC